MEEPDIPYTAARDTLGTPLARTGPGTCVPGSDENIALWESRDRAGVCFYVGGKYAQAAELFRAALKIAEAAFRPNDARLAASLNNLGEVYRTQGRYREAEPL